MPTQTTSPDTPAIRQKNRQFGLITGTVFLLIGGYGYVKNGTIPVVVCAIGAALLLAAWLIPQYLTALRKVWEKIGRVLGTINTYLILTLLYFLVFVPYGVVLRVFQKDILGKKLNRKASTYWVVKDTQSAKSSMKHQF